MPAKDERKVPMIRYCLWDVGKTIYDYTLNPLGDWVVENAQRKVSVTDVKRFDFGPYMRGQTEFEQLCRQICHAFEVPYHAAVPAAINRAFHRGIGAYFPETRQMMAYLQRRGIENVIFSNALPILSQSLKTEGLVKAEHIFTSYESGLLKPDPAVYEYVRSRLGCRFEEMMAVDDKIQNIETVRNLGINGVFFSPQTIEESVKSLVGYDNREEVENALRRASKGQERARILQNGHNRSLIAGSGANVTLWSGKTGTAGSMKKRLQNVYVGVLMRRNPKNGKADGWGALGGLAEMTGEAEFLSADERQRRMLATVRDDVVLENGKPVLIRDRQKIAAANIRRETREELGNLGIYDFNLDEAVFEEVVIPGLKDDNFVINRWNGEGTVWAITPHCHLLQVEEEKLDYLQKMSTERKHEADSEARNYRKVPLFEALSHFGKKGGAEVSEDGRDLVSDYRYPHEWITLWALAAKQLRYDDRAMLELASEVQAECRYRIGFAEALRQMNIGYDEAAAALGIKSETVEKMQHNTEAVFNGRLQNGRML